MNKRPQVSSSILTQDNTESNKNVLKPLDLDLIEQTLQDVERGTASDLTGHSLRDVNQNKSGQILEDTSSKTGDVVAESIDLSPLVNELISSSSPFDVGSKEFEDLVPSSLVETSTTGDGIVSGNNVGDLFVGELPVLDISSSDLSNLSAETTNSDVADVASKEEENVIKQLSHLDTTGSVLEANTKESSDNLTNERKQQEFVEMKKDVISQVENVSSDTKQEAPKGLNITEQELSQDTGDPARSDQNVALKDNDKPGNNIQTDKSALDEQKLLKNSKQEETGLPDDPNNEGNLDSTSQNKNDDVISVSIAGPTSEIVQNTGNARDKKPSESCPGANTSSENIKTSEDKQQAVGSNFESEVKNPEDNVTTAGEDKTNEMMSPQEKDKLPEDNISNTTTTQALETQQVTQEHSSKDDDGKQENLDEQLSGSEIVSLEGSLRTSNRKRKAPPPRDLSVHPPGWVRSALQ